MNILGKFSYFIMKMYVVCTHKNEKKQHTILWQKVENIMKTCLCNFEPLKSHFYIEKNGFVGVYIIFPISAIKHR